MYLDELYLGTWAVVYLNSSVVSMPWYIAGTAVSITLILHFYNSGYIRQLAVCLTSLHPDTTYA